MRSALEGLLTSSLTDCDHFEDLVLLNVALPYSFNRTSFFLDEDSLDDRLNGVLCRSHECGKCADT